MKKKNMYATLGVVGAAVAALLFIPLPAAVYCDLEVEPRGAEAVYVEVPGILETVHVEPGQWVDTEQELAKLSSIDLELEIQELESQLNLLNVQLMSLEQQQSVEEVANRASRQKAQLKQRIRELQEQIAAKSDDRNRLTLTASRPGMVIPPQVQRGESGADGDLPTWSGTPLDEENLGAMLMPGERGQFCWIGDPNALKANLVIDQADIEFVQPGQDVEIILEQDADRFLVITGTIKEISPEEVKVTSARLAGHAGGDVATQADERGNIKPLSTSYAASVPIDASKHGALRVGLTGRAKIHTAPRTLANRLWRYLRQTFSFEL